MPSTPFMPYLVARTAGCNSTSSYTGGHSRRRIDRSLGDLCVPSGTFCLFNLMAGLPLREKAKRSKTAGKAFDGGWKRSGTPLRHMYETMILLTWEKLLALSFGCRSRSS
jgi:hypothetical protein